MGIMRRESKEKEMERSLLHGRGAFCIGEVMAFIGILGIVSAYVY